MENPIEMDDSEVALFQETTIQDCGAAASGCLICPMREGYPFCIREPEQDDIKMIYSTSKRIYPMIHEGGNLGNPALYPAEFGRNLYWGW